MLPRLQCPRRNLGAVTADIFDPAWNRIEPVYLKETVSGGTPLQSTWFKVAWDERHLRVLFHAEDIDAWATHREHDAPLYEEEVVEVFLDPVGDLESYFEIEVNPLNAVCDLVLRRSRSGYRKDFAWHCEELVTLVTQTASTWTVEMAIPFGSLGSAAVPAPDKAWRVNFYRIDRPKGAPWELSAWSPTGRPLFHVQDKFGYLEFVD